MSQRSIPCIFMRGGTSHGPFFLATDLPADPALRDRVLLRVMGSPDLRQIDGMGGADPLTSKVAVVGRSQRAGCDVDYLFAQVSIGEPCVDTQPSCGNMLAAVAPFAIERGLIRPRGEETPVVVFNVNTATRIEAVVRTPGGRLTYDGEQAICGVPGTAAPVVLNFLDVVGAKTGALLPTGAPTERIDGVAVSCVDAAMPVVLIPAAALGITGYETEGLDRDAALMQRLERIRREAGERMGLGDVSGKVIPKLALLAPPCNGGSISSRYFTPDRLHKAHAVTGAICVASATLIPQSIAAPLVRPGRLPAGHMRIEHPSGWLDVHLEAWENGDSPRIDRAGVIRTARKIMEGTAFVPRGVWP